jgi:hypothetical protein
VLPLHSERLLNHLNSVESDSETDLRVIEGLIAHAQNDSCVIDGDEAYVL